MATLPRPPLSPAKGRTVFAGDTSSSRLPIVLSGARMEDAARWRQRTDDVPSSWIERYILEPWWAVHMRARGRKKNDGNCGFKDWRPREGAKRFALAYAAISAFCMLLLNAAHAMSTSTSHSWQTPLNSPRVAASSWSFVPFLPPWLLSLTLLLLFANSGFAYTSFVTTRRPSLFRGYHGDFLDLGIVNACTVLFVFVLAVLVPGWGDRGLFPLSPPPPPPLLLLPGVPADAPPPPAVLIRVGWGDFPAQTSAEDANGSGHTADSSHLVLPLPSFPSPASFLPSAGLVSFVSAFFAGLHVPYLAKRGLLSGSLSAVDLSCAFGAGAHGEEHHERLGRVRAAVAGLATKLGFIATNIASHLVWAFNTWGEEETNDHDCVGPTDGMEPPYCRRATSSSSSSSPSYSNPFFVPLPLRLFLYVAVIGAIAAITYVGMKAGTSSDTPKARGRWYLHFHHYVAGLLLTPLCPSALGEVHSLALLGLAFSQFVEGAARWSCAPLWHRWDDDEGAEVGARKGGKEL